MGTKKLKRALGILLTLAMCLSLLPNMAFAAEVAGVTYTPPANHTAVYALISGGDWYDYSYDAVSKTVGDTRYTYNGRIQVLPTEYVLIGITDIHNLKGRNLSAIFDTYDVTFETINGYEFAKTTTTDYTKDSNTKVYSIVYSYIDANGQKYNFVYSTASSNMPNLQDFNDMMKTVRFASHLNSGESHRGGKTTTVDDDGNTIVEYLWDDAIKIYVNNERITPDTNPIIVNDRTLVPIRAIAEKLGYSVNWFSDSQTVSMQKGSDLIQLSIGSKSLYHNSTNIIIDVLPMIYESRTYLPVRAVTEAMGCKVDWNSAEQAVYITK